MSGSVHSRDVTQEDIVFFFTEIFQTHVGDEITALQLIRAHAFKLGVAAVVTVVVKTAHL